jgi:hypothetical protein
MLFEPESGAAPLRKRLPGWQRVYGASTRRLTGELNDQRRCEESLWLPPASRAVPIMKKTTA